MHLVEAVEETIEIQASANDLFSMVADIERMGDWSPENIGGHWLGRATEAVVGAQFRGDNRRGLRGPDPAGPMRWHTICTIADVEPGRRFSFTVVMLGLELSEWSYSFEETSGGCRVTEGWVDRRASWVRPLDDGYVRVALRKSGRAEWNRQNIRTTLANLKEKAELLNG